MRAARRHTCGISCPCRLQTILLPPPESVTAKSRAWAEAWGAASAMAQILALGLVAV
jgi:hypothetical protein